jgi:hypothetical protein
LGAFADWLAEYKSWIFLSLLVIISGVIIFVLWYVCCRGRKELATMKTPHDVPHLELEEEHHI